MNEIFYLKFFRLLSESSQATNEKMQSSYEEFITSITKLSRSEDNYSELFRKLNVTRIELSSLETSIHYEQGKKCPKIILS